MLYKQIGIRIRQRRKEMGITQEKLSEMADISLSFYGHIERGTRKLSVDTLYKLVKVLNLSADELLGTGLHAARDASARKLLLLASELAAAIESPNTNKC